MLVGLTLILVVPPSPWADGKGKLAELSEQLGKMVEHPKSKSTQPRFARRWVTLYMSGEFCVSKLIVSPYAELIGTIHVCVTLTGFKLEVALFRFRFLRIVILVLRGVFEDLEPELQSKES